MRYRYTERYRSKIQKLQDQTFCSSIEKKKEFEIIDASVLCNMKIKDRELEKTENILMLKHEIRRHWNMEITCFMPIVFGAL